MAVLKEFTCFAHGDFESTRSVCPHGCKGDIVQRAFRTAPAIQTQGYRNINKTFQTLANEHGLSNMSNSSGQMRRGDGRSMQQAAQLIAPSGQSVDQYFRPLADRFAVSSVARPASEVVSQTGSGVNSALHREGGPMMSGGIALPPPRPFHDGGQPFDGRNLGTPE